MRYLDLISPRSIPESHHRPRLEYPAVMETTQCSLCLQRDRGVQAALGQAAGRQGRGYCLSPEKKSQVDAHHVAKLVLVSFSFFLLFIEFRSPANRSNGGAYDMVC